MSTLKELQQYGQSIWLDYIQRSLMASGELATLIREDGIRGLTSNPSIFEKAIAESSEYDAELRKLATRLATAKDIYEQLAINDIQAAADVLRPVYDETRSRDGYVSLEVSPEHARDTEGTIDEARRLWRAVGRDNVMIKVPGTPEGIPAIEILISEGININVTLLFAVSRYVQVATAYVTGLKKRSAKGGDISRVSSVASFFVSRVDTAVDALLKACISKATTAEQAPLRALLGKAAIANAKLAYESYEAILAGPDWKALEVKGAQTQRVLWASTGTKNPAYRDVVYIEELVGKDTVNTVPPATLEAFRQHGLARSSLTEGLGDARATLEALARAGISMDAVTLQLLDEGQRLFAAAFRKLLDAVDKARPITTQISAS
jgi:transaldolase/glucose-6-phosphate isomerase